MTSANAVLVIPYGSIWLQARMSSGSGIDEPRRLPKPIRPPGRIRRKFAVCDSGMMVIIVPRHARVRINSAKAGKAVTCAAQKKVISQL